jgi:hypothetical protein
MNTKKLHASAFILTLLAGSILIYTGLQYNLSHFDTPLTGKESLFNLYKVDIGYAILALSPLIIKRYIWSIILIAIALAFYAYGYFAG